MVLVHGFPELWYSWRHQLTGLADAGFKVVAPDMRGYGGSPGPAEADQYTIHHLVGDIVALIRALGADRAVVAGHDWGSQVAWHTAPLNRARIQVPALYLAGDRDFVVQGTGHARLDAELRQWAPQLRRTMILPGCGHWTQQERPAEVTAALADFASSLDHPGIRDPPVTSSPPRSSTTARTPCGPCRSGAPSAARRSAPARRAVGSSATPRPFRAASART
ncbi:pimeloyl-ACP methyl ester carboxylesterase [Kitasatospora acidiphila]